MRTHTLFRPHALRYDIVPPARLVGARLELLGAAFPPPGWRRLVLWRPGGAPAFVIAKGRVFRRGRAWLVDTAAVAPDEEVYVLCWS